MEGRSHYKNNKNNNPPFFLRSFRVFPIDRQVTPKISNIKITISTPKRFCRVLSPLLFSHNSASRSFFAHQMIGFDPLPIFSLICRIIICSNGENSSPAARPLPQSPFLKMIGKILKNIPKPFPISSLFSFDRSMIFFDHSLFFPLPIFFDFFSPRCQGTPLIFF